MVVVFYCFRSSSFCSRKIPRLTLIWIFSPPPATTATIPVGANILRLSYYSKYDSEFIKPLSGESSNEESLKSFTEKNTQHVITEHAESENVCARLWVYVQIERIIPPGLCTNLMQT